MPGLHLTPEEFDKATAVVKGAEPAKPSNDGLLSLAATMRARHNDPSDPWFGGRKDRIEASELQLQASLLKAGVAVTAITPQSLVQRQYEASWTMGEIPLHLHAMVSERVSAAEQADRLDPNARSARIAR